MLKTLSALLSATILTAAALAAAAPPPKPDANPADAKPADKPAELPPGWLPISRLDDKTAWADVREVTDRVQLYLPPGVDNCRGVFACVVFHSQDPRALARHWRFALVAIPWPMLWDVGLPDKRSPRPKVTGLPMGDMSVLLRYLDAAAAETKRPELAVAPIVGWLMQNGELHADDLRKRAPDRVIAWADSFPNRITRHPELTAAVPFAYAWETNANDEKARSAARQAAGSLGEKATPPSDLRCRASTYGWPHGVYSKYNFFAFFLDRCVQLRLPAEPPPPGQPTRLRPVERQKGWVGDFNPACEWAPIAPFAEARGLVEPVWLPDEYAAWAWRSYHSAKPDLKLAAPQREYKSGGGPDRGVGYGEPLKPGVPLSFEVETTGSYAQIEYRDGDRLLGSAQAAPWKLEGVKLERGLRVLFAVGVRSDGSRVASRPAVVLVE